MIKNYIIRIFRKAFFNKRLRFIIGVTIRYFFNLKKNFAY
nr:MAG TPA: hypothetical protein [Caudoviricetes sp.]DAT10700.1 MAG TPA: hypothetical protein [Caudoviricetes sp.]